MYKCSSLQEKIIVRFKDIETVFDRAVRVEQNGRRTVTTGDIVVELEKLNWHWHCKEANTWIENHVTIFRDISRLEGDARTFMLYNPNGGAKWDFLHQPATT